MTVTPVLLTAAAFITGAVCGALWATRAGDVDVIDEFRHHPPPPLRVLQGGAPPEHPQTPDAVGRHGPNTRSLG